MRLLPGIALVAALAACGADPAPHALPPLPAAAAEAHVAADAVTADPGITPLVARLLDGSASPQDRERAAQNATPTVAALLAAAARGNAVTQGRAPAVLLSLGQPALPGIAEGLRNRDVTQRRIAAMTLLQCSDTLHGLATAAPVVQALAAARDDQDPAVAAAAIHAWRRATGDTSTLDQSRAAHEAAERAGR